MKKNIQVIIMVDGVQLEDLSDIQEEIEKIFDVYPDKRITMQIQDDPLVNYR